MSGSAAAGPSGSTMASSSMAPAIRSHYRKQLSFAPLYTGGASTAITSDGNYFFAPVNDSVHVTHIPSGRTAAQIPSDLEEVSSLALSADQGTLVIASRSLALRIVTLDYQSSARQSHVKANGSSASQQGKGADETRITWSLARSIAKTHDAPVVVMAIDHTSTLVATGAADGCAKVWDIRGGYCTHVFRGHGGVVSSLRWNMPATSSEKYSNPQAAANRTIQLFSGSIDGRVRVWDLRAPINEQRGAKPIAVLESHFSVVRGLALSADGQRLVTVGRDRMLAFWERKKGLEKASAAKTNKAAKLANDGWTLVETVAAGESLESAGFIDADELFYTGGAEGEARIWSFSRQALVRLQPNGRFVRGVVGKGKSIKRDDDDDDEKDDDEDETRAITEIHWMPHSRLIVTVHADQNIVMRDVATLQSTRQLAGFNDQIIDASFVSPLPDGQADTHLAVATNSTFIRVYTLGAKQHNVATLPDENTTEEGHKGLILCLDKTSDGRWLASGGKDRSVRVWAMVPVEAGASGNHGVIGDLMEEDEELGEVITRAKRRKEEGAKSDLALAWRCVAIAEGHTESVGAIAFARRPATPESVGAPFLVSGSQDRTAKVWDLSPLKAHIDALFDEKKTRADSMGPIQLKSLTTQKIHDKDINALDVSPNNALLLTGSQDKTAKVFGIQYVAPSRANSQTASASLKPITTCRGHKRGVWSVAFSPADAVFLTGSSDRTIKLWSINDGFSCVKNYVGHTNSVLKVRFLKGSNGLQCLSGASDGLVKVWNVRTEECLDTLDGHEERVWGLDCTRNGDVLVSGGADGMIRFWQDFTQRADAAQTRQKQRDVEQEQRFSNMVATRDYRNAISLALAMRQPRRLLNLLSAVGSQRHQDDAARATGTLLSSAVRPTGKSFTGHVSSTTRDAALAEVLARAGVLTRTEARQTTVAPDNSGTGANADTASITGSAAVDEVIETLRPQQLATLLIFVRDWNTSVRTSAVAQTTLHAILRYHSAEDIVAAFDAVAGKSHNRVKEDSEDNNDAEDNLADDFEGEDDRRGPAFASSLKARKGRAPSRQQVDLGNVLDAMLPYTQRHYDRAQRILTESAMLEYTLACMDTVLGVDDVNDDDDEEEQSSDKVHVNGTHDSKMDTTYDAETEDDVTSAYDSEADEQGEDADMALS